MIRIVALILTMTAISTLPWSLHPLRLRGLILMIGLLLWAVGAMFSIAAHFGEPLAWYRTPFTAGGSIFVLAFVFCMAREKNRGG